MKNNIILVLLLNVSFVFAQETNIDLDEDEETNLIIDELLDEKAALDELIKSYSNFQFLYVSVDYNSATYFSGRDIGVDQYNLRPQITYMNSKGFFMSVSGVFYSEFEPRWDFTSISAGYGKSIGKKKLIRLSTSYTKYFYSKGVDNPYGNAINLGIGIRNKQRSLGTRLTNTFLFGEENSFQLSWSTYVALKLVKTKKFNLKLRPQISLVAGQQTFFEERGTVIIEGEEYINYSESDVFDMINTRFILPLQYSNSSMDIELGYNFNFPNELEGDPNLKNTNYFSLSLAYLFDL